MNEVNINIELHNINHEGKKFIEAEVTIHTFNGILTFNLSPEETKRFIITIDQQLKIWKKLGDKNARTA